MIGAEPPATAIIILHGAALSGQDGERRTRPRILPCRAILRHYGNKNGQFGEKNAELPKKNFVRK